MKIVQGERSLKDQERVYQVRERHASVLGLEAASHLQGRLCGSILVPGKAVGSWGLGSRETWAGGGVGTGKALAHTAWEGRQGITGVCSLPLRNPAEPACCRAGRT